MQKRFIKIQFAPISKSYLKFKHQTRPFRGVPSKRYSENMQQIYKRAPRPNCDFNKVALQLY